MELIRRAHSKPIKWIPPATGWGDVRHLTSHSFDKPPSFDVRGILLAANVYDADIAGEWALRFVFNWAWPTILQIVDQGDCRRTNQFPVGSRTFYQPKKHRRVPGRQIGDGMFQQARRGPLAA